ncbi:MAG: hypothetical protein IPN68_07965 [Bacteroidetes bacterium]|nr:hypothetical protein [Bacteroidota bacterium]
MTNKLSRRRFFTTAGAASAALAGSTVLTSCIKGSSSNEKPDEKFPVFLGKGYTPPDGPAGLLFSMIGYETEYPLRIIVRLPRKELLNEKAICRITSLLTGTVLDSPCSYWGELWKSNWWVCEFAPVKEESEWKVEIISDGEYVIRDKGLRTGKNILWNETAALASVDMLERRVHFTKVGAGWQDAGTLWVESCSQSVMVTALVEMLEIGAERIDNELKERIYKQITVGLDYMVMLQKKAEELGYPKGAMSHDLHGHEKDILPNDAVKAVIALAGGARVLPETYNKKKENYSQSALLTFRWLQTKAKPMANYGLSLFQRGLPEGTKVPANEWQTRDLVSLCRASVELSKLNIEGAKEAAVNYAQQIAARQIPEEKKENLYWGHFLEYDSMSHSEKSWIHGIVGKEFGADIGGVYPNYLMPLIEMTKIWSDHEDVLKWKETLRRFTYGYLIPACKANPFYIVPQGIFGDEGAVWFCGTFHGTNTIYGFTAALALELSEMFNEPILKEIAYGNLQWLAGLNGGITKDNLKASVVFSTDVPEGAALPASMMCGVGKRWAGTWFQTRGVICNGFSTGKQFVYDTEPKKVNDGPFSLTDEDWIPHSAAWLTGLVRL